MSGTEAEVIAFVDQWRGRTPISLDTSFDLDLGLVGFDAEDLIVAFAEKFSVSPSGFDFDRYFVGEPHGLSVLGGIIMAILSPIWQPQFGKRDYDLKVRDLVAVAQGHPWP